MDQADELYIVRSWNTANPNHYGIGSPMTKIEAGKLVESFKRGNNFLGAVIEKYTGQKAGVFG